MCVYLCVCVCVCVCLCVGCLCGGVCVCVCVYGGCVCICVCVCACLCVCLCGVCVCLCVCDSVCVLLPTPGGQMSPRSLALRAKRKGDLEEPGGEEERQAGNTVKPPGPGVEDNGGRAPQVPSTPLAKPGQWELLCCRGESPGLGVGRASVRPALLAVVFLGGSTPTLTLSLLL